MVRAIFGVDCPLHGHFYGYVGPFLGPKGIWGFEIMNDDDAKLTAPDMQKMQAGIRLLLEGMGVDLSDPELKETPLRVAMAWRDDFIDGYVKDPKIQLGGLYPATSSQPIFAFDIQFISICPHHLLPFEGRAHLAYLPGEHIVGLSRLAKFIHAHAHRLTLQETLTQALAESLVDALGAKGAGFVLEGRHGCMAQRGVLQDRATIMTCHWHGEGAEHLQTLLQRKT